MKTSNFNNENQANIKSELKAVSSGTARPKQFAAVDMWNILKQRKMIYRRSA